MPRIAVSVRLWQTGLFVVVIVVAALIVAGSLTAGLKNTLSVQAASREQRSAALLASRVERDASPVTPAGTARIRSSIAEYRGVFDSGVWVFDAQGRSLVSAYDTAIEPAVLSAARDAALSDRSYGRAPLVPGGWAVASAPLLDASGRRVGAVVSAGPLTESLSILDAARARLWVTFWVALVLAGFIGFAFSEFISRRIDAMSNAAAAIAGGDFSRRLPTGLVPDEIADLAEAYNRMALKLGAAFSAIQASEREIAVVVESMAEGVVALDAEGCVRIINAEAKRLLGDPDIDFIGEPAQTITHDPAVLDVIAAGLAGAAASTTVSLGSRTVLLHCTPLAADGAGDGRGGEGVVLMLADVTEQRRIEEAQRRFVADASHEMRTPVAALRGMLELLQDGAKEDPAVRDDFLATMLLETERLGRLVADLLTLAQLESGSLRLDRQPQSPTSLLDDVAQVMRPLAERSGVRIDVQSDVTGDVLVSADRDRIVQVLLGFVDNALKHSPRDTTVHLRATLRDTSVEFEVADEGVGISAEQLEHVFDRFYRADEARGGRGGAGLGLAIAKEIVEAHDSAITVASTPGHGTRFGFALPVS